jgi:preprotein translocase subunit SecD
MREKIRLGLDLQGGIHLVLEVVTDDAIRLNTDEAMESFQRDLQENGVTPARQMTRTADNEFQAVGVDVNRDSDVRRILNERYLDWDLVSTQGEVPNTYTLRLKSNVADLLRDQSVDQAIQTIRNRIDELGVAEPVIQRRGGAGEYEILVQLPGMTDPARAKNIIKSTAQLALKLVESGPFASQAAALQNYGGILPGNLELLPSIERVDPTAGTSYYVVQRSTGISGRDLKSAFTSRDENGRPAVSFTLNAEGAGRFGRLTESNIRRPLGGDD